MISNFMISVWCLQCDYVVDEVTKGAYIHMIGYGVKH